MKILKWLAVTVLFVGVSGLLFFTWFVLSQRYKETSEPTAAESVPESIMSLPVQDIRPGGNTVIARLLDATLIDGFPCAAGEVRFTGLGQLYECVIAWDAVIQGNLIPKNTRIKHEMGNIWSYFFPMDTNIQDISCVGGKSGSVDIPAGFYSSGRLRGCYTPSNVTIQEVPCRKGKPGFLASTPLRIPTPIVLHENGNLMVCTLSRDAEIDGQSISAGSQIAMSQDGQVTIQDDSWQRRTGLWVAEIFGY